MFCHQPPRRMLGSFWEALENAEFGVLVVGGETEKHAGNSTPGRIRKNGTVNLPAEHPLVAGLTDQSRLKLRCNRCVVTGLTRGFSSATLWFPSDWLGSMLILCPARVRCFAGHTVTPRVWQSSPRSIRRCWMPRLLPLRRRCAEPWPNSTHSTTGQAPPPRSLALPEPRLHLRRISRPEVPQRTTSKRVRSCMPTRGHGRH